MKTRSKQAIGIGLIVVFAVAIVALQIIGNPPPTVVPYSNQPASSYKYAYMEYIYNGVQWVPYNFTFAINVLYNFTTDWGFGVNNPITVDIFIHVLYASNGTGIGHGYMKAYDFAASYPYIYITRGQFENGSKAILATVPSASIAWDKLNPPNGIVCGPGATDIIVNSSGSFPGSANCNKGGLGFYQAQGIIQFPVAGETYFHLLPTIPSPVGNNTTYVQEATQEDISNNRTVIDIQATSGAPPTNLAVQLGILGLGAGLVADAIVLVQTIHPFLRRERPLTAHIER